MYVYLYVYLIKNRQCVLPIITNGFMVALSAFLITYVYYSHLLTSVGLRTLCVMRHFKFYIRAVFHSAKNSDQTNFYDRKFLLGFFSSFSVWRTDFI